LRERTQVKNEKKFRDNGRTSDRMLLFGKGTQVSTVRHLAKPMQKVEK